MSAFTDAFARGMQGMEAVSSGTCPGCADCMEIDGYTDEPQHSADWHTKEMASGEHSFSWRPCGVCGTALGGDRNTWHWIDPNDPNHTINHEHDMCDDCALFLANGDEPEGWR